MQKSKGILINQYRFYHQEMTLFFDHVQNDLMIDDIALASPIQIINPPNFVGYDILFISII